MIMDTASRTATHRQRGATLLITLVILLLLALIGFTAIGTSRMNQQVVGNAQFRQEAKAAAQQAIEYVLSSSVFTSNPDFIAANPITIDVTGNGVADYSVAMLPKPACIGVRKLKTFELDESLAADIPCFKSAAVTGSGIAEMVASAAESYCADTRWEVSAQAQDPVSKASVELHQGVAIRVSSIDAETFCK
ncbi:MAG: hypothetical protein K0B16_08025 [Burkholderiaceae bacterium]|nr:hypothetical protein [Burkholderiaceae bacterium]